MPNLITKLKGAAPPDSQKCVCFEVHYPGLYYMRQRYCLALDLRADPALIAEYEAYHRSVWPAIVESIRQAGIEHMEIYRIENRLFMIMEVNEQFSFEQKQVMDAANPVVQEWETLMWKYQQALPGAAPGEKWKLMERIFEL